MTKLIQFLVVILLSVPFAGFTQIDSTFQDIEEVLVSLSREKEIVFEDSKYYIVDFTISETSILLLMKSMGTYFVCQLDENMAIKRKLPVEQNASSLFDDCMGNTHLVTKDSVFYILDDLFELSLVDAQSRTQFMEAMKKCAGSTSEKIIIEEFSKYYQFHEYYTVDLGNGARKTIYEINDTIRAKSLHDAARDLYSNIVTVDEKMKGQEMSKNMFDGIEDFEEIRNYREKNAQMDRIIFFENIVAVSSYNPMFVVRDTLYFFNHAEGRIDQLDASGTKIRSIPIKYHLSPGWGKQIYLDITSKRFYRLSLEDGVYRLTSIPLNDENKVYTSEITEHAHPKKVLIRNGYAYYTYKPNVDANLNVLYRQKL